MMMLPFVLGKTPTVILKTNTNYLLVFLIALTAAAVTGGFSFWISSKEWKRRTKADKERWAREAEADHQRWLRQTRAAIFTGSLSDVRNGMNQILRDMKDAAHPVGQPPALGLRYSALHTEACAASKEDGEMVERMWQHWNTAGGFASDCSDETKDMTNPEKAGPYQRFHDAQLGAWERCMQILDAYNTFLKDYLGQPLPTSV